MSGAPSVDIFGGVRVVELAQWVFVPVTGALLADWGADVIKIERPDGGDGYRGLVLPGSGSSVNFALEMANRNKRSAAIDLKSADGRAVMLRLIEQADVFLTNFLPSVLDRLGLGVDELRAVNPHLIVARGHGYGVRGDDADRPAYDSTAFWARGAIGRHPRSGRPARADPPAWCPRRPVRGDAARVRHRGRIVPPDPDRGGLGRRRLAPRHRAVDDRFRCPGDARGWVPSERGDRASRARRWPIRSPPAIAAPTTDG